MTDHYSSQEELFDTLDEDSNITVTKKGLRQFRLSQEISPTPTIRQKTSYRLSPPLPIKMSGIPVDTKGKPPMSASDQKATAERGRSAERAPQSERSSSKTRVATPPRANSPSSLAKNRKPSQTTVTTGQGSSSATTLGFGSGTSKGNLVRSIDGRETNLWSDIRSMQADQLDKVLQLAKTNKEADLSGFVDSIQYQGFNRESYIRSALSRISVKHFSQFAVLGAVRGSNFRKITETSENVPTDLVAVYSSAGFVKTAKKKNELTILRCTASIPHWCAYWMLSAGVDKKIVGSPLHAALQFPGATSLPMSEEIRRQHVSFSQQFSALLPGGTFNANIYMTAYNNQIPLSQIPDEILHILGIPNRSSYREVGKDVVEGMTQALVRR